MFKPAIPRYLHRIVVSNITKVVLAVLCIKGYRFHSGPVMEAEIDVCDLGKSGKNVSRRSKGLGPPMVGSKTAPNLGACHRRPNYLLQLFAAFFSPCTFDL